MRVLLVLAIAACTVGRGPDPVTARPPADPDRMPTEVLEHQDPGADTSKHPTLSRSEASMPWRPFDGCGSPGLQNGNGRETFIGCGGCTTRDVSGTGTLGLVALATVVATRRRRRRSSLRRNATETRTVARSTS